MYVAFISAGANLSHTHVPHESRKKRKEGETEINLLIEAKGKWAGGSAGDERDESAAVVEKRRTEH